METLTGLVEQVLQTNQDLCLRLRNLESLLGHCTIRSSASLNEHGEEDGASTIRPMRFANDPVSEESDQGIADVITFTFERDLGQSRVYKRVLQRHSLVSLSSSAAPSLGWSCFSKMSLASVSNISVISLPIAANELSNGEHYHQPSIPPQVSLRGIHNAALLDRTGLLDHEMSAIGRASSGRGKKIVILGEKSFPCMQYTFDAVCCFWASNLLLFLTSQSSATTSRISGIHQLDRAIIS